MSAAKATVRSELVRLSAEVARHDRLYHEEDLPEISDAEYDLLRMRLEELEAAHPELALRDSPLGRVGGVPARWLAHRRHERPMLSLRKVRSVDEWEAYACWVAKSLDQEGVDWTMEPKLDGVAVELVYERGRLAWAATRGDGLMGEDVTAAMRRVVPVQLDISAEMAPQRLEVRGEAVLSWPCFAALNQERAEAGKELFATPRGAAAGALRHGNTREAWERGVRFVAWGLENPPKGLGDHETALCTLGELGLEPAPGLSLRGASAGEVAGAAQKYRAQWGRGEDPLDGVVLKLADARLRRRLGATATAPRWAVALRIPAWEAGR